MISLKSVYFIRSGKELLKNINWDIKKGQKWILFGKNGSGKTLLLTILTGYNFPSSGIVLRSEKYFPQNDIREIRKSIGYVATPLKSMMDRFSSMTILEVVLSGFFATVGVYGPITKMMNEKALSFLENIGMLDRYKEPFVNLSDGEKQKVLIMRAIINEPDLLILDEPAVGLDIPSRETLLELIKELSSKGISIIYTTHHTEEIIDIFDNILILDRGEIFYKGNLEGGINSEKISRLFKTDVKIVRYNGRYFTLIGGKSVWK